ncbi:Hypp5776 [Branchiostoma lanceolatum]|uniref:Hypp5776 protein n=1 Tax=Branchiostoma lanceolatum TaxID=7740 RepID=A0A8J9WGB9_BRALA|nr:Hypp5776 [Branchiostoma lanceolatum]
MWVRVRAYLRQAVLGKAGVFLGILTYSVPRLITRRSGLQSYLPTAVPSWITRRRSSIVELLILFPFSPTQAVLGKAGVFLGILAYSVLQLFTRALPLPSALTSDLHTTDGSLVSLLLHLVQNSITLCACVSASVCVRIVLAVCFGLTRFLVDVLATVWIFFATAKESLLSGVLRRFRRYWDVDAVSAYLEHCVLRWFGRRPSPRVEETDSDDSSGSEDEMLFGRETSVPSDGRPFRGRSALILLFLGVPMVTMRAVLSILPSISTGVRRRIRTETSRRFATSQDEWQTVATRETSRRFASSHSEQPAIVTSEELRFSTQKASERVELCRKASGRVRRERCAVCLDRKSRVRLLPCGHNRLCERCAARIMDPNYQYSGICPLCRTSVNEVVTGK